MRRVLLEQKKQKQNTMKLKLHFWEKGKSC